jgi:CubicO group peptidase (beta-lactamase class C family)
VHGLRTAFVALAAALVLLSQGAFAQSLTVALFERYLDPLRLQAGIPGLSAAVVQGGRVVMARGFGMADVERSIAATEVTPYPIAGLTQTFGAALVLQLVERGHFDLVDRIQRWTPAIPAPQATVGQVLTHTSTGTFFYDPSRFAALTEVVEYYGERPFSKVLADEILDRLAMTDTVPGREVITEGGSERAFFDEAKIARYGAVLQRMAVPYRVDARGRTTRMEQALRSQRATAATGVVSTALDLVKFDAALDDNVLLRGHPLSHGWFVQTYNNQPLLWQFGLEPGAYSSLILKVPRRGLTLILLANSDRIAATFGLHEGDVTRSPFALLFLRAFAG